MMKKVLKTIVTVEKLLCGFFLTLMLLVVTLAVIGRYTQIFNMGWSDELARYCMIWVIYLGLGINAYEGALPSVDLITSHLSHFMRKVFLIIRTILVVVFCVLVMYYGMKLVMHQVMLRQMSVSLHVPMWLMYSSVPLGGILLVTHYILACVKQWMEWSKPEGGADPC